MWRIKHFKTNDGMHAWLKQQRGKIQYEILYVENGYAVQWRPLRVIH